MTFCFVNEGDLLVTVWLKTSIINKGGFFPDEEKGGFQPLGGEMEQCKS